MGLDSDILWRAGAVKFSPDACSTAKKKPSSGTMVKFDEFDFCSDKIHSIAVLQNHQNY